MINLENKEKLTAEEIQQVSEADLCVSENSESLNNDVIFSNNSPINIFSAMQSFLTNVVPTNSEGTFLTTEIQRHQEWALAQLKALSNPDKFVQ